MPINPITLDKYDPHIIKSIEHKVISKIVHETSKPSASKDEGNKNNNFNGKQQEHAAQQLGLYLMKFKIKLEYKIFNNRVRVKLKNSEGKVLIDIDIDDVEKLFDGIKKETGNIIDLKG